MVPCVKKTLAPSQNEIPAKRSPNTAAVLSIPHARNHNTTHANKCIKTQLYVTCVPRSMLLTWFFLPRFCALRRARLISPGRAAAAARRRGAHVSREVITLLPAPLRSAPTALSERFRDASFRSYCTLKHRRVLSRQFETASQTARACVHFRIGPLWTWCVIRCVPVHLHGFFGC